MNLPDLLLPYELSDEAAAHITEILHDLAAAFDSQYFGQVPALLQRTQPAPRHRMRLP